MCRLMAFISGAGNHPMLLADIVLWPNRSIIKQSYDARERKGDPSLGFHLSFGALNADGFGVSWYGTDEQRMRDPTPCVFKSITPAWNNENLARLSCKIVSPVIFAHVRAAYPGMPVSEQNCHPFTFGRYTWMHNGVVAGFAQIKRALLAQLSDVAYNSVSSFHSDSAVSFALFIHHLPNPFVAQPAEVLLQAMQDTIHTISQLQQAAGINATSLLNYVVSDGTCLVASRFVSPASADAASLYYAEGASFQRCEAATDVLHDDSVGGSAENGPGCNAGAGCGGAGNQGESEGGNSAVVAANSNNNGSSSIIHEAPYELSYGERGARVAFVASEPITGSNTDWVSVPKNTAIVVTREKGGFVNVLRCPLLQFKEQETRQLSHRPSFIQPATCYHLEPMMLSRALAEAGAYLGDAAHHLVPSAAAGRQWEIALCLEALSRGLAAKSRPWVSGHTKPQLHLEAGTAVAPTSDAHEHHAAASRSSSNAAGTSFPSRLVSLEMSSLEAAKANITSVTITTNPSSSDPAALGTVDPSGNATTALTPDAVLEAGMAAAAAQHCQRLVGHIGSVLALVLDEGRGRMYSAGVDCTIKTWSTTDNACLGSVVAGKRPVAAMQLRGRWLYSAAGRKLRVWDTCSGSALICVDVLRVSDECGSIRSLLVLPGKVLLGCQDSCIRGYAMDESVWEASEGSTYSNGSGVRSRPPLRRQASSRLDALMDNTTMAGAPPSDTVPAKSPIMETSSQFGHVGQINAMVVNATGDLIITAGSDAMIRVWRSSDLSHVRTLRGHRGSVLCLLVIENLLVSGARDNTIRVWDLDLDMMCRCTLTGHKDDVTHLTAFTLRSCWEASKIDPTTGPAAAADKATPSANAAVLPCTVVASASADGTVRLWTLTWTCLCVLATPNPGNTIMSVAGHNAVGHVLPHKAGALTKRRSYSPPQSPFHPSSRRTATQALATALASQSSSIGGAAYEAAHTAAAPSTVLVTHAPVPSVLCCVLTGTHVCAGYSDGEVRLWPCEGVHLLALQLVAADLGLTSYGDGLQIASDLRGSTATLQPKSMMSPSMLSPPVLSPLHPFLTPAVSGLLASPSARMTAVNADLALDVAAGNAAAAASSQAIRIPSMDQPKTLTQANLSMLLNVLSTSSASVNANNALQQDTGNAVTGPGNAEVLPAVASAAVPVVQSPTSLVNHSNTASKSPDSMSGSLEKLMPRRSAGSQDVVGSASGNAAIVRSSGSPLLDVAMRQAVGAMFATGTIATSPTQHNLQSPRQSASNGFSSVDTANVNPDQDQTQTQTVLPPQTAFGSTSEVNALSSSAASPRGMSPREGPGGASDIAANGAISTPFRSLLTRQLSRPQQTQINDADVTNTGNQSLGVAVAEIPFHRSRESTQQSSLESVATIGADVQDVVPAGSIIINTRLSDATSKQEQREAAANGGGNASGIAHVGFGSYMGIDHLESGAVKSKMLRHVLQSRMSNNSAASDSASSCRETIVEEEEQAIHQSNGGGDVSINGNHVNISGVHRLASMERSKDHPCENKPSDFHTVLRSRLSADSAQGDQNSISSAQGSLQDPTAALHMAAAHLQQAVVNTAQQAQHDDAAAADKALQPAQGAGQKLTQIQILNAALSQYLNRPHSGLPTAAGLKTGNAGYSNDMTMEACLREFVRIRTVSSNTRLRDECVKGAKFLAKLLESLGADVKVVRPFEDKNPVVIGRLGHDPSKATVCFYGHYDVQPAQEPDWRTDPFELNAVNEYLYGRGTSDNKGPVLAFIFAVKELMDQVAASGDTDCSAGGGRGSLPVNIVFIFEGEEENGSIGFREAVTQNLHWFQGVQLIVISNTNWVGETVPCLTYGMRGMMSVSVTVSGPKRDVHSGNDGGVFCEPMMDLIATMASVMQPGSNNILIPGFSEQVAPSLVDLAWESLQQHGQGEFSRDGYQAALGVPALTPPPGAKNLLEARWCRPSLSIVDMRPSAKNPTRSSSAAAGGAAADDRSVCYRFGPTRFSVIPHSAVAKISVRFVARQDPKHIVSCLRNHVHTQFAKLGSPNSVSVTVDALGNWWEADVRSKWMVMAEAAIRREWGCEPLFVREGGTMPVASVLEKLLSAPAIMIPLGQSSDAPHLANERIRRVNLIKGKGVIRALLEEVAGLWAPNAPGRCLANVVNCTLNGNASALNGNAAFSTCPSYLRTSTGELASDGYQSASSTQGLEGMHVAAGSARHGNANVARTSIPDSAEEEEEEDFETPKFHANVCGAVRDESPFKMVGKDL